MAMFPWQLRVEGRRDEAVKRVVDEEMHVSMMGACGLVGVIRLSVVAFCSRSRRRLIARTHIVFRH